MSQQGRLPSLAPNTALARGKYTIEKLLGAGGFGYVYLARDRQAQPVAIKQCIELDAQTTSQFGHELAVLKTLAPQSKYFPQVIEEIFEQLPGATSVTDPKYMFAVMEFVPGKTLESEMEERLARGQGPFPENDALAWITQVLEALDVAHSRTPPIIHRDIKPGNIMLLPGGKQIKIIDVGIAKIGGVGTKTQRGAAAASPGYAPPEQYAQASQTDRFSDIYAVGATMYFLVTGMQPVEAPARISGIQVLTPPQQINPRLSALVGGVIMRALEIDVTHRFQTAADMTAALQGKAAAPTQICSQCGHPNQPSARFCKNCSMPLQGFVFQQAGAKAQTPAEFAVLCDRYWQEAVGYLMTNKIDQWLQGQGQAGQQGLGALQYARSQYPNDPNLQLDALLRQLDPQRPSPQLQVRPNTTPTTAVEQGSSHSVQVTLVNVGRGYLTGSIVASETWATVKPAVVACAANQNQLINIILDAGKLAGSRTGRHYAAQVNIQTNGGDHVLVCQLQVTAAPQLGVTPMQLDFGQVQHGQAPARPMQIANNGAGQLTAALQPAVPWLLVSPATVTVPAHSHVGVNIQLLTRGLDARGVKTGDLYVSAGADGNVTVPVTVNVAGPFSLSADPGAPVQNVEGLVAWCDTHWREAVQSLRSGELLAAVTYLDEPVKGPFKRRLTQPWPVIVTQVRQAAALPEPNLALETALRSLGAEPPAYNHNWSEVERELGLGIIPDPRWMMPWWTGPSQVVFSIRNTGRGYLHGRLLATASWLVVDAPEFGCLAGQEAQIVIRVLKNKRKLTGLMTSDLFDLQVE